MLKLPPIDSASLKRNLLDGLKTSMIAFVILFVTSLSIAVIFNFAGMDFLKSIAIGNLTDDGGTKWGRIVKMTTLVMNLSLFAKINEVRIGIIIFLILPCLAFFFAKNKNMKNGISVNNLIVFLVSSLTFASLITIYTWTTKGDFLGVQIKAVSFMNYLWIFCLTYFIQFFLAFNYSKQVPPYILASRWMLRIIFGMGTLLGLIGLIFLKAPLSILERILVIFVLLPNMAVYKTLMLMGNELQMSYTVSKAYEKIGNSYISSSDLPIGLRIAAICLFGALLVFTILRMKKERFWINNILFSVVFSGICTIIGLLCTIRTGTIILVGDIFLGYNLFFVFLIPMIACMFAGLMIWMIRKLIEVIAEV